MQPESALATLPRPNEKVAIVSFLLVFLCGALLGAVIMSVSGLHQPAIDRSVRGTDNRDP